MGAPGGMVGGIPAVTAQTTLTPLHLQLIKALAEEAVKRGYLTSEPAIQSHSAEKCAERVELPEVNRAA